MQNDERRRPVLSRSNKLLAAAAVFAAVAFTLPPASADAPSADDQASLAAVAKRVAQLEKLVARDPYRPDATVLARLEVLEKAAKSTDAVADKKKPTDAKSAEDLKDAVAKGDREQRSIERRLADLERLKLQKAAGDDEAALRDLRRDLDGLKNTLRDLSDKVSKLERRVN